MLTEGSTICSKLGHGDTQIESVHLGMLDKHTAKFKHTLEHSGDITVTSPNEYVFRLPFAQIRSCGDQT